MCHNGDKSYAVNLQPEYPAQAINYLDSLSDGNLLAAQLQREKKAERSVGDFPPFSLIHLPDESGYFS